MLVVHLEIFETDVDINTFCYEKTLEEIRRNFFDNEAVGMKQFFKRGFLIFCKEVLILKIKKRTLLSFLLKNIFFFEKHKLVSTIEVLYKIIFG